MKFEIGFLIFFLLITLILFIESLDLNFILTSGMIGAGFMPSLVSILLILLMVVYLLTVFFKNKQELESNYVFIKSTVAIQIFLTLCLVGSIFLIDFIGMLPTIALLIITILFVIEKISLIKSVIFGIVSTLCIYLIFVEWLNLNLPKGVFGWG